METNKHPHRNTSADVGGPSKRRKLARLHAAKHVTHLALERWRHGSDADQDQVKQALRPIGQARWLAQCQHNYVAWLNAGGFAQAESETIGTADRGTSTPDALQCLG